MVLVVDVTPTSGPAYTLLAFVIVITGGLGSMPGALLGGLLIGLTEALGGVLHRALGEEHVRLRPARAGAAVPPAGHARQEGA
jgi:branched-subunit amino acid ABC-type transport system permease component